MSIGAEGRNAFGQVFSETSYAGEFYGAFNTNGQSSGTYQDVRLIGQRLIHFNPQNFSNYGGPNVTLNSGNGVISWQYQISSSSTQVIPSELIYYGAY